MESNNNPSQEVADKQSLKAAIRAQQEANKGLSQEEKQRLRKLKKEEKKAKAQAKSEKKNEEVKEIEEIPLPPQIPPQLSKEEIRAQQEANKDLSQEEKQRLRKLKNEEKKAMKQAKMAKKNGENQQTEDLEKPQQQQQQPQQLTKDEIRAQQEANKNLSQEEKQRLRKLKNEEKKAKKQQSQQSPKPTQAAPKQDKPKEKAGDKKREERNQSTQRNTMNLFSIDRLFNQYQKARDSQIVSTESFTPYDYNDTTSPLNIHPVFRTLGLKMGNGDITGSSHRAEELLNTIIQFVEYYPTSGLKDEYYIQINNSILQQWNYIEKVRAPSVPMRYIYDNVMDIVTHKLLNKEPMAAKRLFLKELDMIRQGLQKRKETIVDNIVSQIDEDDVIITFGESKRITEAFVKAAELFNPSQDEDFVAPFRVIVIGGRPKKNNENMLRRLVEKKVGCSIAPINALPFVMESATKVLVSAAAMLANGYALADIGTAIVATTCKTYHIPLIVVADTTKFSKEVRLESIAKNEINNPNSFRPSMLPSVSTSKVENNWILENHENIEHLKLFNLCYDLVPAYLISGIVTEISIIPASSVASINREYENDMLMKKLN